MKRLLSLGIVLLMCLVISGCSVGSKPDKTVTEFIEAVKVFDSNRIASSINPSNTTNKDKVTDISNSDDDKYKKYFLDYIKSNAAKITYKIKGTKIENDSAIVTVDFKYIDGGPLFKATLADFFTKAMQEAFSGVQMTDEDSSNLFITSMQKQRETIPEAFIEKTVDIKCVKVDNKWYVDEPSDELLDVILSNINSIAKQFNQTNTSTNMNSNTVMEQAQKKNMTIVQKAAGDAVEFATIKVKVNNVEESQTISSEYSSPKVAKQGAKFIIVNLEVTNITNKTFTLNPDFIVVDNKNREFKTYSDSIGAIDDYLDYKELSPSIKETGNFVYELPADATSYSLVAAKAGTNELYIIKLK